MTVYKYVPYEVGGATKAAIALLNGKKVPGINGTRPNGSYKEPMVSFPVTSITKANYKRLFTDGWLKRSEVCVGEYKKYCK
jgi:ABC-type xylose transport system substrate-binding protein